MKTVFKLTDRLYYSWYHNHHHCLCCYHGYARTHLHKHECLYSVRFLFCDLKILFVFGREAQIQRKSVYKIIHSISISIQ